MKIFGYEIKKAEKPVETVTVVDENGNETEVKKDVKSEKSGIVKKVLIVGGVLVAGIAAGFGIGKASGNKEDRYSDLPGTDDKEYEEFFDDEETESPVAEESDFEAE